MIIQLEITCIISIHLIFLDWFCIIFCCG